MNKIAPVLLCGLVFCCAAAAGEQDTFRFSQKYHAGEKSQFQIKLSMEAPQAGSIDISMERTDTVLKVYENGDADVESVVENIKVLVNGAPMDAGQHGSPKSTRKLDKYGRGIEGKPEAQGENPLDFLKYLNLADGRTWKVGEAQAIQYTEKGPPAVNGKGTGTLVSLEAGVAKFTASLEVTTAGNDKPSKMTFTSFYEAASGRLNKTEGTITGLPMGVVPIDSVQIVVERKKG